MARKIRIQFAGSSYHIMSRGNQHRPIFLSSNDRQMFLKTRGDACNRTGWKIHAYVLMFNHSHLLMETSEVTLLSAKSLWIVDRLSMGHHSAITNAVRAVNHGISHEIKT